VQVHAEHGIELTYDLDDGANPIPNVPVDIDPLLRTTWRVIDQVTPRKTHAPSSHPAIRSYPRANHTAQPIR